MNQNPYEYYVIFEDWSLDPNQWSMLIDGIAVLLAIFGVVIAYILYIKQRKDKSKDAFDFFQSSLPELRGSIKGAIESNFRMPLQVGLYVRYPLPSKESGFFNRNVWAVAIVKSAI